MDEHQIKELKKLLKQNLEISQENLKITRKMRRLQNIGRGLKLIYWLVIISVVFGAYYYIQPVITKASQSLSELKEKMSVVGHATDTIENAGQNLQTISPDILEQMQDLIEGFLKPSE